MYELTEWGTGLEPILMGLQRSGAASPSFPHEMPVGCDAAMLAVKNTFDATASRTVRIVAEVRFATDVFCLTVVDGTIDIGRGPTRDPDLVLETDPATLEDLVFGGLTVTKAERASRLTVEGDRRSFDRLLSLFAPPTI